MMNTNTPARGLRGDYAPGRGDLTGHRHIANADEKIRRDEAMKVTRNALQSEPAVLVTVPGGRDFLVPREAFNAIVGLAEAQAAGQ